MPAPDRPAGSASPDDAEVPGPRDDLAAARVDVRRWREAARRQRVEAAAVQRRPLVRAAVAVDRRFRRSGASPVGSHAPDGSDPDTRAPDGPDPAVTDALAAERAGALYWRDVAEQRRLDAATVQRRPLVRTAIAVDRRTRRLQGAAGRAIASVRVGVDRAALRAGGWRARRSATSTGSATRSPAGDGTRPTVGTPDASAGGQASRSPTSGEADSRPPSHPGTTAPETDVGHRTASRSPTVLTVRLRTPSPPGAPGIRTDSGHDADIEIVWPGPRATPAERRVALRAADAAVAEADATVVCLLGPDARPAGDALDRLARVAAGDEVVAGPVVVHPSRPWRQATAHDGRVRTVGLRVDAAADGTPSLRHVGAGAGPSRVVPPPDPIAVTGAALAVRRDAWEAVGGLGRSPVTDPDAAVVDLCLRLGATGRDVRIVPDTIVVDGRPVRRRRDLRGPLADDGPAWRALVERHGPRLVPRTDGTLRVAVSTATPSRKMAPTSGDWHYACDLSRALEAAGHQVVLQTEEETDDLRGRISDVHLVLRGLAPVRRTEGQAHVLWVISHPEALTVEECDRADLVLVASRRFADDLRTRTTTPVEVMWQATDPVRFAPGSTDPGHRHPVTVVASTRGVRRASVDDAIAAGLRPAVHGQGWSGLVDPALVCSTYVAPDALAGVYRSADVVLNDHWETMRRWGFMSNRILDVLACGTPVVSDHLPEIPELFDDLVPTWTDPDDLARIVDAQRRDPDGTATRVAEARRRVLAHHTFAHRVDHLVARLRDHALVP